MTTIREPETRADRSASPGHSSRATGRTSPYASVSLRTFALAALSARAGDGEGHEDTFLRCCHEAVVRDGTTWRDALGAYLERPADVDAPLMLAASALRLTITEILAVSLAAAVEEDLMAGRAVAHLQAPVGGSRPTIGLLADVLGGASGGNDVVNLLATGAAVETGMLEITDDRAPLAERTVGVPLHLLLALNGRDGVVPGCSIGIGVETGVPLPRSVVREAERHAAGLVAAPGRALVIRAGSLSERKSVAGAVAHAMKCRPLFIESDRVPGLVVWALLRRLVPIFSLELGPGERRVLETVPFYSGPILAVTGPDGSIEAASGTALSWTLPVPPQAEREALWHDALENAEVAATLAGSHRHGCGRIAHLSRLAKHRSVLDDRPQPSLEDVVAASRTGDGAGLDALAQPLLHPIPDEALVIPPVLKRDLDALLRRCRVRDALVEGLGASAQARYAPGVRTLFVGPSGTGKTLAACWLATKLGLPLYRVDLAAVTSKYIGETEKNLAQLLARAEQAEVVLLFDEADSMFGKRTEVREANDRFANAQTNYLLQRIETYDGITILTSNSRMRFDPAFSRRLDLVIDFALPDPEQRRALWQSHLGTGHRLTQGDLNRLAAAADIAGGQIRNVVLSAAVPAHEEHRPIAYADILDGLVSEYRKLGRQVPLELNDQTSFAG
jgi:hypothetical protein